MQRGVAQLRDVVRRNGGRHADGDALRAIGQQIGKCAGQHHRLGLGAVVGRTEIDGVFVDALEQALRHIGEPRLGVTHRRRVIAVDIAEVALPVDQRIARCKVLGEPHQSVVDRLIAVRMERTHHFADDLRGFLRRAGGVEPQPAHAEEDAPMYGFEAVACIGQRAVRDRRQGVDEVALFQRLAQWDVVGAAVRRENRIVVHSGTRYQESGYLGVRIAGVGMNRNQVSG